MKGTILILFLGLLCNSNIFSLGFDYGYIILKNNDTIKGYINNKSDRSMSFGIEFKSDLNCDSIKEYSPGQIKSFGFYKSKKTYFTVDYVYRKDTLNILYVRIGLLIFSGKTRLYKLDIPAEEQNYYYEKPKPYSYVIEKAGKYYTLSQSEEVIQVQDRRSSYYNGGEYHMTRTIPVLHKYYIGLLAYVLSDCPSLQTTIKKLEFNDKAMLKLLKKYEECDQ